VAGETLLCASCQATFADAPPRPQRWWSSTSVPAFWILGVCGLALAATADSLTASWGRGAIRDIIVWSKTAFAGGLCLVAFVLSTRMSNAIRAAGVALLVGFVIAATA
jgi:hypothetical protein